MDIEADGRAAADMAVEEGSGYGIVAVPAPGMAAEDAAYGKIHALERTVLAECLKCILGTCGSEAAGRLLQRRDADLIEPYQQHERQHSRFFQQLKDVIPRPHLQSLPFLVQTLNSCFLWHVLQPRISADSSVLP